MKIKRIKFLQIPNCPYCKMELRKVPAVYHLTGACKQACEAHKHVLEHIMDAEQKHRQEYSEADYQTWMRL